MISNLLEATPGIEPGIAVLQFGNGCSPASVDVHLELRSEAFGPPPAADVHHSSPALPSVMPSDLDHGSPGRWAPRDWSLENGTCRATTPRLGSSVSFGCRRPVVSPLAPDRAATRASARIGLVRLSISAKGDALNAT